MPGKNLFKKFDGSDVRLSFMCASGSAAAFTVGHSIFFLLTALWVFTFLVQMGCEIQRRHEIREADAQAFIDAAKRYVEDR